MKIRLTLQTTKLFRVIILTLIFFSLSFLILILSRGDGLLAKESEGAISIASDGYAAAEMGLCHEGELVWAYEPSPLEGPRQVEDLLAKQGISAIAMAQVIGEKDGCGEFTPFAVEYAVTVTGQTESDSLELQVVRDRIYEAVIQTSELPLDNLDITFINEDEAYILRDEQTIDSFVSSQYWKHLSTNVHPSARYTHGTAYDSKRKVTVLFGGDDTGVSRLNDTWEFNGAAWKKITSSLSPPGRVNIDQALIFDSNRDRTILFGGLGKNGYLNDTWEYDGVTWKLVETDLTPEARDSHAMAYDNFRGESVLFGGHSASGKILQDTWKFDGQWHLHATISSPSPRFHHAMTYDDNRNVFVLFGGLTSGGSRLGDTWEFDGESWYKANPIVSPPARDNHTLTYDNHRGVVILFGGENQNGVLNDTWEYDGITWRQVLAGPAPFPRKEMSLIYDTQQQKTLLFGGGYWNGSKLIVYDDTWQYGGPSGKPSETLIRKVYIVAYDPLLSNGQSLSEHLNWHDHETLTQGSIDFFEQASGGRIIYEIADTTVVRNWPEKIDGFVYSEDEYLAVIKGQMPAHVPESVDYNKIVNDASLDICGRLNRGEIDEVWIYNGPSFGFYESTLVGPGAYWFNSPPVPGPHNCNSLLPIMGPSPERGLDSAVHNFGHRMESTMTKVYNTWQQNSTANNWERFALVDHLSPNYNYSGCGNIHYPPNGVSDYDYSNLSFVKSNCSDFSNYPYLADPSDVQKDINCSGWACDHIQYLDYWFSNLPNNAGCGPDGMVNNWWLYFSDPVFALEPSSICQTLKSEVKINFELGRQGSYFTVRGLNFPPKSIAQILINGILIVSNVATDSIGGFEIVLDTRNIEDGLYQVTVLVNPSATAYFTIDSSAPLRPKTSDAPVFIIPAGSAGKTVMLPYVTRP